MRYEEFIEVIKDMVEERSESEVEVSLQSILKNNDTRLWGLIFRDTRHNASPTIYLERFFDEFNNGESLEKIADSIIEVYKINCVGDDWDMDFYMHFETVKDRLFLKIISHASNSQVLKDVPYEPFLDMALVPYCIFKNDKAGEGSILVHDSHLELWNVTRDEVFEIARKNTFTPDRWEMIPMAEIIKNMLGDNYKGDIAEDECPMYVLSGKNRFYGAVYMASNDTLSEVARRLESDFYVLPSSVHECIVVPSGDRSQGEQFSDMVREVNATEVDEPEILSNHAYYYVRSKGLMSVADFS